MENESPVERGGLMWMALLFESGLVVLAFAFGWFPDIWPIDHFAVRPKDLALGFAGTVPLLLAFWWMYRSSLPAFKRIRVFLIETLGPTIAQTRWYDVVLLAILAGLCEEVFFRGFLQVWLSQWGVEVGLIASSIVFGLVHAITLTYFLLTLLAGLYLGAVFLLCDSNLLAPMLVHALYDYVAFVVIIKAARKHQQGLAASVEEVSELEPRL